MASQSDAWFVMDSHEFSRQDSQFSATLASPDSPSFLSGLLPAPPAIEYEFGQRAVIILFRGAGELLLGSSGGSPSGVDDLNTQLQTTFSDYYLVSQVFDSYEGNIFDFDEKGSTQADAFLKAVDDGGGILGFLGYSAGGLSAIRLAKAQASRTVSLLVQLDTYEPLTGNDPEDEVLPVNVAQGINYYQNRNRFNFFEPDYDPIDLQGARNVVGSENIDAEAFVNDRSITHRNIDENAALRLEILADFEEFVLRDLAFDPAADLALSGGATLVNNILALAPDANQLPGQALIAQPIEIDADFSFETRIEFKLDSGENVLPGLSFWIQLADLGSSANSPTSLAVAFNPTSNASPVLENAVAVLTPGLSLSPLEQAIAPLDLDDNTAITAWIDYDGLTDELAVFLSDNLTQPEIPLLSTVVDLTAIAAGSAVQFGLQAAVDGESRQADVLTWQLNADTIQSLPTLTVPNDYLNFELTQRTASTFLGVELSPSAFEVGGLDFADLFDEAFYLQLNPDVSNAVTEGSFVSGYDHFMQFGWLEGRRPSSLFDPSFYRAANPDVAQAVDAGLFNSEFQHFVLSGHREGRDPSGLFDQSDYLLNNPDIANAVKQGAVLSGFEHYIEQGAREGRNPQLLLFQEGYYLALNPDVAAAVSAGAFVDGFEHYLTFGCREGRNPSSLFSESTYLASNADVAAAVTTGEIPCGWAHYLLAGRFEGRTI